MRQDPSQDYEVRDESDLKRYRTEVPNIVFDIGLTPYELALYLHFKRIAGARVGGFCNRSGTTLSAETGISTGKISGVKASLARPREELGGKSLIRVQSAGPGQVSDRVTVVDIWPENFAHFARRKPAHPSPHEDYPSPHERHPSCGEGDPSPHETKKELFKKEQRKNEEEERAGARAAAAAATSALAVVSQPLPSGWEAIGDAVREVVGLPPYSDMQQRHQDGFRKAILFVLEQVEGDVKEGARQVLDRFSAPIWSLPNPVALAQFRAAEWHRQGAKLKNVQAQQSGTAMPQTANERKLAADAEYTRRRRARVAEIFGGAR